MTITTKKGAAELLGSVLNALDQLTVQGKNNCFIVVACGADIEKVIQFLNSPEEKTEKE